MNKSIILTIFLIILFASPFKLLINQSEANDTWWDEDFSFRKMIEIPFNTAENLAKYQPINTRIYFEKPCFAQNENFHSIRIIYQQNDELIELESQIYDLNYSTKNIINACSIVFLIPPEANGKETYYLYYDGSKTSPVDYPDHVNVKKNHYRYEPIPGYPFESSYYEIKQHDSIVYGVSYEGKFLGLSTAHQITKFSEKTKQVKSPKNAESWASFDFFYQTGERTEDFSSTIQSLQSKNIMVDGNLMVKMSISSTTPKKEIQTTAEYTYFYCPTEHKRIHTHVKHEALKDITVYNSESLGNICGLQAGMMKSPSIEELNFGEMLPYLHVYDESDVIREYMLDTNPEYTPEGIPILTRKDDVDLGDKAWACFDKGETGLSHSIILSSNQKIISGDSEKKGVQIHALEASTPGLLGLETDLITFYFSRNAYESENSIDLQIPSNFVAEFDAEFLTTYEGGYPLIDNESMLFQQLVSIKPTTVQREYKNEKEAINTVDLTAYIHFSPTPPMGSVLSLLSGINFSYISAELYHANNIISSDIAKRISLNLASSLKGDTFVKKFRSLLHIVDWKNISIFKKITFPDLTPDTYLIKIFKENSLLKNKREFIGFSIVNLTENSNIHIIPKKQAVIKGYITDQDNNPIKDATVLLKYDNHIISKKEIANKKGVYEIPAPYSLTKSYDLNILYQGFTLIQDNINLKYIHTLIPLQKSYTTSLSTFSLTIKDTWNLAPAYQLNPSLTSIEMTKKRIITSTKIDDTHIFSSLPYADYQLQIKYKSFTYEKEIVVSSEHQKKTITFPASYPIKLSVFDSRGLPINKQSITLIREEKQKEIQLSNQTKITTKLPPGIYEVKIKNNNDDLIGKRSIEIIGKRSYELVTKESSILNTIPLLICGILVFLGIILIYIKKPIHQIIRFLIISLLILSILTPWWVLQGGSDEKSISSTTQLFILPPSLITLTESEQDITGSRGLDFLPEELQLALYFFSISIALTCLLLIGTKIIEQKRSIRWAKIITIFSITLLIILLIVFIFAVSTISKIGVGSFLGNGAYNIRIPGEETSIPIQAHWGPGIGFYLCAISISLAIVFYIKQYTTFIKRNKKSKLFFNK